MNDKKNTIQLPYNVDIELLDKIMSDLKNTESDGIKQEVLWRNVGGTKNLNRSYTLNAVKYLGLVETASSKVMLTSLGTKSFRFATGNDRRKILFQNLPDEYMTMFKWVHTAQEIKSNEIKQNFLDSWGQALSNILLDKAIVTFLNYCQYLKLLRYIGKGTQARAIITEIGKQAFDSIADNSDTSSNNPQDSVKPQKLDKPSLTNREEELPLPKEAIFPIIIKTRDRHFDYDMKTELDLKIIDTVISSIKDDWYISQKKKPSEKEGKKIE